MVFSIRFPIAVLLLDASNEAYSVDTLPDVVDDGLRYCVLEYSGKDTSDHYWLPLIFMEQIAAPTCALNIGGMKICMPLDYSVMIADRNSGAVELLDLMELGGRTFDAFVMNPIASFTPSFLPVSIENIYPNMAWTTPKIKAQHILCVPLRTGHNPPCAYFVRDRTKLSDSLDIRWIFS